MTSTPKGFSLIEALVALVILSLVFSAVWGWFGTAATSTVRIQHATSLPNLFNQFTQYLELEDLRQTRTGSYLIGNYQVDWQASVAKQSSTEIHRRQPAWIVALFDVQADVLKDGRAVSTFSTQVVKQWRDPNYIEPLMSQDQ
ncbi:type II secretion system protein J [Bowmanella yangjiangensis]|uniref:Prepilin-type N-terminal cleavage/methylation domain-containing protein n=1 Tax=Bowmanella yangjiangensis TaxID=2811230 RepID=A0ABS3CV82_9ALTE|nr:prepilin-type N-terminal cleavage/methylation domain-containing protein [Bowmanella yangjiangensis]